MTLKIKNSDNNGEAELNPFTIFNYLTTYLGEIPKALQRHRKNYIVQVANSTQHEKVKEMDKICGRECEVTESDQFNSTKLVLYTYQRDFTNIGNLKKDLQNNYSVCDVILATWIRTTNTKAQAFLATFNCEKIPQYITIPGEQAKTELYDYIPNPIK